jgi:hypothetical protein
LAISEHGLKEDEITQCTLGGYTVTSHFCRKEPKGGGTAIYRSRNILQHKPLKWVTEKCIEKTFEVTGIELACEKKKIIHIALYRSPSGVILEFLIHLIDMHAKATMSLGSLFQDHTLQSCSPICPMI